MYIYIKYTYFKTSTEYQDHSNFTFLFSTRSITREKIFFKLERYLNRSFETRIPYQFKRLP